ncbi:acyltransferase family protein [Kitasatospora camelliae]|uniref:Acyltransferase n=1 Tax=Kitasatospora camelliae TaxID=3156397 RepID=A0AAU8K2H5_9ACTN
MTFPRTPRISPAARFPYAPGASPDADAPDPFDARWSPDETLRLRVPPPAPDLPEPVAEEEPADEPAPAPRKGGRDRYLDLLRALALARVILYHKFGWAWLPLLFPSMGVMFALAGSLMARSLARPALGVIRGRLRRLLPPMWLFGAVLITAMVLDGWGPHYDGHPRWWWAKMAFWLLPLSTPPYAESLGGFGGVMESEWAMNIAVPLWYLRAYLWYVLLSPAMLWALRRQPWLTVAAPLALSALINSGLFSQEGRLWETATDFTTFGACWILGLAHQEGLLRRLPQYLAPSLAPMIMIAGLWWLTSRPIEDPTTAGDLETVPFAQAVWSFGYVLLLLHLSPSWERWPARLERWNGLISLLNARAVSVYLWHIPALALAIPLMDHLWDVDFLYEHGQFVLRSHWTPLLIAMPLLALMVLSFGWMEDLAAKRPLRLFPYPRRPRGRRRAG